MSQDLEYEPYQEMGDGISVLILAAILTIIALVHIRNTYQDMCTLSRKTLEYRAHKPLITASYAAVVYTTLIAIVAFAWTLAFTAIQYNFSINECNLVWVVFEKIGFFVSRGALYVTYIIRLHRTYGTSGFGYSVRSLEIVAAIIIAVTIGLGVFTILVSVKHPVYYRDTDNTFPYYCQVVPDTPWVTYAGSGILLFDLVCSFASMFAFIIPLNAIRAAMEKNNPKAYGARARKMKSIGYQYKVLVMAGSFTTFVWIVLLFAQQIAMACFFINVDFLVNCIIICFMSSYYPRDKYYERFCWLCICMCGGKGKGIRKYKSHASMRHLDPEQSRALTADTSTMFAHSRLHAMLYAQVDANKDGRIDVKELADACDISLSEARDIILKHDVDDDGQLDQEEFEVLQKVILYRREEDSKMKALLKEWGLGQYYKVLVKNGYENRDYWEYLMQPSAADKLQQWGFKDGHARHFIRKYKETFGDNRGGIELADMDGGKVTKVHLKGPQSLDIDALVDIAEEYDVDDEDDSKENDNAARTAVRRPSEKP